MDRLPDDSTAPHDVSLEVLRRLSAMTDLAGRLRAGGSASEVEACAQTLAHDAEDVRRLVEHARDLQRAEQGGLTLTPTACLLREVMGMVEDDWKERMATAGLEFRVSYEGEREQAAMIDTGRVRQLFDTLLGRALTETTSGAVTASLRVRPDAGRLMLEAGVEDSGRTLSPGELAHIFDPTETGRSDALASLPTRIGMALANRLVAAMAGVLQAQGREDGGVAITFTVMVPAAELDLPRSPHVLIVEDNAINRLVAEALCEMFDCTSEQARDGVEALEAVTTRAFDLILMDIKMPRMDGVTATRQIRALAGAAGRTPIVALTANAERADVSRYLEAGMNEVVEKPIKPAELAQVLEMLPVWMEGGKTAAA